MAAIGIDAANLIDLPSKTGKDLRSARTSSRKPGGVSEGMTRALQEALLRRASTSGSRQGLATSSSQLSAAQKAQWRAAAKAVTQQMRLVRYLADHSTFSALNVDGIDPAKSKPLKTGSLISDQASEKSADSEVRGARQFLKGGGLEEASGQMPDEENLSLVAQGRCISLGLVSTAASGCGDETQMSSEGEDNSAATSVEPVSAGSKDSTELGDFFKAPKRRTPKGAPKAREAPSAAPSRPSSPVVAAPCEPSAASASPCLASLAAPADVRGLLLAYRAAAQGLGPAPRELESLSAQAPEEPLTLGGFDRQMSGFDRQMTGLSSRQISAGSDLMSSVMPSRQTTEDPRTMLGNRQVSAPAPKNGLPGRQISAPLDCGPTHMSRQCTEPAPRSRMSSMLTPSAKAWRPTMGGMSRMDELRRSVKSLLNKVCPESVATIALKIGEIEVRNAEELQEVISLIFQKALSEPHYCATYADLVFNIKSAFPEFPSPDNGKPQTFKTLLLDVCQKEFESLPTTLEPSSEEVQRYDAEELEFRRKTTKDRLLANMKLIGHLFLRQMLSPRVIGAVIEELTLCHGGCADRLPEGHCVECAVELLLSIGHTLEALPVGKQAIAQVCARLMDLKQRRSPDGRGAYCKRIQFAIQDLLDVRAAGWAKKVFSGVAKTKEEIRMEQERDIQAQARGRDVSGGQVIISGQRPEYIEAAKRN